MRFFRYSQTRTCHYFRAASYVHVHNDLAPARSHFTGVGSGGARGAAAPLNAGRRGLRPPTNWCQWVSETKCEIKQPAVVHSGMAQKRIESFFAPAPRRTATVVQGKLALPGSWHMPRMRLHDMWRRGLCRTYHHI